MNSPKILARQRRPGLRVAFCTLVLLTFAHGAYADNTCPPGWQPAFAYDTTLYPFTNRCLSLAHGNIHFFDESPAGDPLGTVLMLHGNPTWSFLYRDIALPLLAAGYRVIAPDYYGFGLSDKPALSAFGYTPQDHALVMRDFVLALDLQEVILVVHDWGGPIGIRMAGAMAQRFSAFVILDTFLQRLRFLNPGVNHLGVDFSVDNIVNEDEWRETGEMAHNVGISIASKNGAPGSPEYLAVRDAYWAPFLDVATGLPLSPDIVAPTNIFPQNFLLSPQFMSSVKATLSGEISNRPLFMLWAHEDRMWGALRCDEDAVPDCPSVTQCVSIDFANFCLLNGENFFYPQIANIRQSWQAPNIIGELVVFDAIHFVQEVAQDEIVAAIEAVAAAATQAPAAR